MNDTNIICLTGTLQGDAVVSKYNEKILEFTLRVQKDFVDQFGHVQDKTSYIDLKSFQTNLLMYLHDGMMLAVNGYIQQDRWNDQQGNSLSKLSIICTQIQMLGSKNGQSLGSAGGQNSIHKNSIKNNPYNKTPVPPAQPFINRDRSNQQQPPPVRQNNAQDDNLFDF